MNEMILHVAKAIYDLRPYCRESCKISWEMLSEGERSVQYAVAKAAILAMREPSEEMGFAGSREQLNVEFILALNYPMIREK